MNKIIEIIKYFLIGLIQGITEIFPISSSGHLSIIYKLFNINSIDKIGLTVFLHLASCISLLIFYKKEIISIVKDSYMFILKNDINKKENFMFLIYLIIATIPSIIVGFLIKPLIEETFNNIYFVGIGFLLTSLIILYNPKKTKTNKYNLKNTLITGLFQSFALLPGISRSGTTMFGSKIAKLDSKKGKKFTFFLLFPISIGSTILSILDINFINGNMIILYLIAFISAFIFSFISLKLFINKFNNKHNIFFSIYLWFVSFCIFTFL